MGQVLKVALTKEPEAIEWTYDEKTATTPPASIEPAVEDGEGASLPH
jgi:hypothetical protein